MITRTRLLQLAYGVALTASIATAVSFRTAPTQTPFVPDSPPRRALGDFDGDGRLDIARIQGTDGDRHISVELSGSAASIHLDASVIGVVQGDVDHDGDLDLVAATSDGKVLIWLNDGHGHFLPQPRQRGPHLTSEPSITQTTWPASMLGSFQSPFIPAQAPSETTAVVTYIRPPTPRGARTARRSLFAPPRAPPLDL